MRLYRYIALFILLLTSIIVSLTSCYDPPHIHEFEEWEITKEPTCQFEGKEIRYCVCGEKEARSIKLVPHSVQVVITEPLCEKEGQILEKCSICDTTISITRTPATHHNFEDNACSVCKVEYLKSNAYRYDWLKEISDLIALDRAIELIKAEEDNSPSLSIISNEIVEVDNYFRYITKTVYKDYPQGEDITTYLFLELSCKLDGSGNFVKIKNEDFTRYKDAMKWGLIPENFSLDFYYTFQNPEKVSLKQILAKPLEYNGKYVVIKEDLVLGSKNLSRNAIFLYLSTGSNKWDYDSSTYIAALYNYYRRADYLIELEANCQKLYAAGYIKLFSDGTTPYLSLYEIGIYPG